MILITGAAGQLGRLVISELLKTVPPEQIVAAVREPSKVGDMTALGIQVRRGDYTCPSDWDEALKGVDKVLLISSPDVGCREEHHRTVTDAIAASDSVGLVAYTSMLRADSSGVPYAAEDRATEAMVLKTGKNAVFLRHSWYIENYTMNITQSLQTGMLFGCAGSGVLSGASREDYAAAAACVLTSEKPLKQVYELAGDESFTLPQVAAEMTRQTNTTVNYVDMPEEDYRSMLVDYGVPDGVAMILAMADSGVARGDLYTQSRDLSTLIGRPTLTLREVIAKALLQQQ
ncbi:SDR family oxidoreductase [Pectobacterium jejuense]|uniref:SDR family oxidoreductase n=1 Tax=Pectobacterium TaxID=122277 RepID=UPI00227F4DB8|nr:SDR family oxidoreductase [Pectobacterium jejuense]MCY9848895.1 SDR family oxidoreductase [Pectobacterium jejuense]